jgi:integrase
VEFRANQQFAMNTQAQVWLERVTNRKRKPTKPSTISNWKFILKKWVLPEFSSLHLAEVNNLAMKKFVGRLCAAKLSPKTIHNISQLPKMIVASAINEEGEEIYPRKWNAEFIDMPVVTSQHQPAVTGDTVSQLMAQAEGQYQVLFALVAGTGMRAGEALALECKHVSEDGRTLTIQQSVWQNQILSLKTANGIREIDLHPDLSTMLKAFIGNRTTGLIFHTNTGRPLCQTNVRNRYLYPLLEEAGSHRMGFHSFRRFRTTHLRKQRAPEDLIRFWLGHANQSITDGYSKLSDDLEFRKKVAESVGLGFEIASENSVVVPYSASCTLVPELVGAV